MIINPREWAVITQEARMNKGKLINVELSRGRYVKMYEADAIAQGLIKPPASKVRTPPANKMRKPPPENKIGQRIVATGSHEPQTVMAEIVKLEDEVALNAEAPPPEEQPGPESIPGVGKASVRALAAHGVITLDALKEAQDLDYLPAKVLAAIAKWRVKRG